MDLCDTCIHARDSEGQPICHAFRWLVQLSEEIAEKVQDEDIPVMRLSQSTLAVEECRAYESNEKPGAKVLSLVK